MWVKEGFVLTGFEGEAPWHLRGRAYQAEQVVRKAELKPKWL